MSHTSTMKIFVGSTNPVKINSARQSFEKVFVGASIECEGYKVPSDVSDQPMGEKETRQGAINRANNVLKKLKTDHSGDEVLEEEDLYVVGMEVRSSPLSTIV